MSNIKLPTKPKFKSRTVSNGLEQAALLYVDHLLTQAEFDQWYAKEIEPLFRDAKIVYGQVSTWSLVDPSYWGPKENGKLNKTHTAILTNIQPIKTKEETVEDLLEQWGKVCRVGTRNERDQIANKIEALLRREEETAEDMLRNLVFQVSEITEQNNRWLTITDAYEKAKAFLARKDKK